MALTRSAIRCGVEWIDVERSIPYAIAEPVCSALPACTRCLVSAHVLTPGVPPAHRVHEALAELHLPWASAVKLIYSAAHEDDSVQIAAAARSFAGSGWPGAGSVPVIALAMGAKGKLSRVLNEVWTPVTHAAVAAAAPGQMSAAELRGARAFFELQVFKAASKPLRSLFG